MAAAEEFRDKLASPELISVLEQEEGASWYPRAGEGIAGRFACRASIILISTT